jgi:hypothetical protein
MMFELRNSVVPTYQVSFLIQIIPAPVRVGEDEPPPSWDPVPDPFLEGIFVRVARILFSFVFAS